MNSVLDSAIKFSICFLQHSHIQNNKYLQKAGMLPGSRLKNNDKLTDDQCLFQRASFLFRVV